MNCYEEAKVVSNHTTIRYDVELHKGSIIVTEHRFDELVSLKGNHREYFTLLYDDNSGIVGLKASGRKGKMERVAYKDTYFIYQDHFHSDARMIQFSLQFEDEGSERVLEREKVYYDPKYFGPVYLNDQFDIKSLEVEFIIDPGIEIDLVEFNFDGLDIDHSTSNEEDGTIIHNFSGRNLSRREVTAFQDGSSHIYPHIVVVTKGFTEKGQTTVLFEETQDVYNWYMQLVADVEDNPEQLEEIASELIRGKTAQDKISSIFYWIQDNIRYIAFEDGIAGYRPDACQNVFRKRYGDCKGMANLMKHLLVLAGFDARLCWLGTRRIKYDYSLPSLAVDNHMICAIRNDDGTFSYFDPTEKMAPIGEYAERIQGSQVLIENGSGYILGEIPTRSSSDNSVIIVENYKVDGTQLTGKVKQEYYGEERKGLLRQIAFVSRNDLEEQLAHYAGESSVLVKVDSMSTSDLNDREVPLHIEYSRIVDKATTSFGDEMYIEHSIELPLPMAPQDDRKYDIVLPHKYDYKHTFQLAIPADYNMGVIPEPMQEEAESFFISLSVLATESFIQLTGFIDIKNARIPVSDFELWTAALDKFELRIKQPIVLKSK